MSKKRKIAIITGTRAEYGILKPLLNGIKKSAKIELVIFVAGMHFLRKHGFTVSEITKDGFKIKGEIKMYSEKNDNNYEYGLALARGINDFSLAFSKEKPDIVVIFGDRLEALAATLASATLGIALAHIHGGDKTDSGHIDESIRHAITRFAHLHFVPTGKCKKRVIKWGEEPKRIFLTGALGIDSILQYPVVRKKNIFEKLGFDIKKKFAVFLFHPVSVEFDQYSIYTRRILSVLRQNKIQSVIIYPNNDNGSEDIIKEIEKFRGVNFFRIFPNLPPEKYVNFLRNCDFLIGNSSSGIIEAPVFKIPVIKIGSRNIGREHAKNIIFTKPEIKDIEISIHKVLHNKKFKSQMKKLDNPWGKGVATKKIITVLEKVKLSKDFFKKKITY